MNFKALAATALVAATLGMATSVEAKPYQMRNIPTDEYGRQLCWTLMKDNGGTCALAPEAVFGPGHVSSYTEFHESVVPACKSGAVPAAMCRVIGAF